jgi:hypothetical protein
MEGFDKKFGEPDRILGLSEYDEESFKLDIGHKILRDKEKRSYEREKSAEEQFVIYEILKKLPYFLREYGLEIDRFMTMNQIHIIDDEDENNEYLEFLKKECVLGRYSVSGGTIDVVSRKDDLVLFAHSLAHEMVHANSFVSIQIESNDTGALKMSGRRVGFEVGQEGELKATSLNEAITEELAKRFCEGFFPQIHLLKEDFKKLEREDPLPSNIRALSTDRLTAGLIGEKSIYAYPFERTNLNGLIDELYQRNKGKYDSAEEVFKLFSKATLNGRLLPVARLVDDTFGKGTFRMVVENIDKDESLVLNLIALKKI